MSLWGEEAEELIEHLTRCYTTHQSGVRMGWALPCLSHNQGFSKGVPQTSSISITWRPVRNVGSLALPQTFRV